MGFGTAVKNFAVSSCLEYDTPKIVTIRSRFIGILNRLVQIAIILYVVVWVFIIHKGYQFIDNAPVSGVTTKLKGVAYTNSSDPRVGQRLWDAADLNVPPEENGAFFLTTNVIVTHNQTQGECTELWGADCTNDTACLPEGKTTRNDSVAVDRNVWDKDTSKNGSYYKLFHDLDAKVFEFWV